jgi:hypothetical protein
MSSRNMDKGFGEPVIDIVGQLLKSRVAIVDRVEPVSQWGTSGSNKEMQETWNLWLEEAGSLDPY